MSQAPDATGRRLDFHRSSVYPQWRDFLPADDFYLPSRASVALPTALHSTSHQAPARTVSGLTPSSKEIEKTRPCIRFSPRRIVLAAVGAFHRQLREGRSEMATRLTAGTRPGGLASCGPRWDR